MNQLIAQTIDNMQPRELAQLAAQVLNHAGWLDDDESKAFFNELDSDLREQLAYIGSDYLEAREAEENHERLKRRYDSLSTEQKPA